MEVAGGVLNAVEVVVARDCRWVCREVVDRCGCCGRWKGRGGELGLVGGEESWGSR